MKQFFKYILLFLVMFSFNSILKAEDDGNKPSCTYNYQYASTGQGVKSEKMTISYEEYSGQYIIYRYGKRIPALKPNEENDSKDFVVDSNGYYYFTSNVDSEIGAYDYNTYTDGCPKLYAVELTQEIPHSDVRGKVNIRKFCTIFSGQCAAGVELSHEDINNDVHSSNKTEYKFSRAASELFRNSNAYRRQVDLYVTVDENGNYYLKLGSNNYEKIDANSSNDILWEQTDFSLSGGKILLAKSEFASLKASVPYISGTSSFTGDKRIYLNTKGASYYITTSPTDKYLVTNYSMSNDDPAFINKPGEISPYDPSRDTCKKLLGDELVKYIQSIFTVIKVLSIILAIVMAGLDLSKVISNNKEDLMKTINKWVKRLIILVLILLLPTIIDMFGNVLGYEDVLCGIK